MPGPPGPSRRPVTDGGAPQSILDNVTKKPKQDAEGEAASLGDGRHKDLYAVVEVACCLHKFVNLEMRSQGWYALRVKLMPDPRIKAVWTYSHTTDDECQEPGVPPEMLSQKEKGWSWRSQVVRVQYCYDNVIFKNATPCFQVFVRQPHKLTDLDFTIKVELIAQLLTASELDIPCAPSKMKPVASEVLRLRGVAGGLLSYQPVSFGAEFWGQAHVLLASALVGFATRNSMHSMGWAVGKDLCRPKGGKPRRRRNLSVVMYPPTLAGSPSCTGLPASGGIPTQPVSSQPSLLSQLSPSTTLSTSSALPPRHAVLSANAGINNPRAVRHHRTASEASDTLSTLTVETRPAKELSPHKTLRSMLSFSSIRSGYSTTSQAATQPSDHNPSTTSQPVSLLQTLQFYVKSASPSLPHRPSKGGPRVPASWDGTGLEGHPLLPVHVQLCLEQLYTELVAPLQQCVEHLSGELKLLPKACYAPQTYDTMKTLLQVVPPPAQQAFTLATSAARTSKQHAPASQLFQNNLFSTTSGHSTPESAPSTPRYSLVPAPARVVQARLAAVTSALSGPVAEATITTASGPAADATTSPSTTSVPRLSRLGPQAPGSLSKTPVSSSGGRVSGSATKTPTTNGLRTPLSSPPLGLADNSVSGASTATSQLTRKPSVGLAMGYSEEVVAADVATWQRLPGPQHFVRWLPLDCTPDAAVLYLHAVLARLMRAAATEWGLLQWLLDNTSRPLACYLRCHWEDQQPQEVAPWVMAVSDLVSIPRSRTLGLHGTSVSKAACRARAQLALRPLSPLPQVLRTSVWDAPLDHPVLLLDDSMGPHMTQVTQTLALGGDVSVSAKMIEVRLDMEAPPPGLKRSITPPLTHHLLDKRKVHLVIFVHGYQGAPTDLGPLKAHLQAIYHTLECRFSSVNEGRTEDSLEVLGDRLAEECVHWVETLTGERVSRGLGAEVHRISFVGHSMGVMIIRAALANPKMSHLLRHLWLLLSIGAPLLGQVYNPNTLLSAGMGVLKAVKKNGCLHQMDMSDARGGDPQTSWLYQFNTIPAGDGGSLQAFKRVVLVASEQDRYVPYHSAELSWCEAALRDKSWRGAAYADMLGASLKGFGTSPDAPQLLRVGVHFPAKPTPSSSFLSDMLGRTAHVALIESDELARLLAWGVIRKFALFESDPQPAWL